MFYFSAGLAIIGTVLYHHFVKLVPGSINPVVSLIGQYVAALVLGVGILPLFPAPGGLWQQVRQLNWIQLALAVSVVLIELGFLLMYRAGWNLSTGNLVTGVFINLLLAGLGVWLMGERMQYINAAGVALCLAGVALISYRPA